MKSLDPRARGGGATSPCSLGSIGSQVSIHAPAGGATRQTQTASRLFTFQSTRPRGARQTLSIRRRFLLAFQSTRPRGARHSPSRNFLPHLPFQSTRPRGARQMRNSAIDGVERVSIHAPAGGATKDFMRLLVTKSCFNPRARGGRDKI